jgi:protein-L-isoaspartate(D-aspartate) O-methyltransferase
MNVAQRRFGLAIFLVCVFGTIEATRGQGDDPYSAVRRRMVQSAVVGAGVTDKRVIQSLVDTPRHEFVERKLRDMAYFDMSLPIGFQQTISSPFIVAFMTECLETKTTDKVLEIGTGSGYQAAVLSPLVKNVYSIEIIPELGRKAHATLKRLKYDNVLTKVGDGFKGWQEHAPFDKIIVTCSPEKPPLPLIEQLRDGGMMVIPVGERYQQILYVFRKIDGKLKAEALRPTLFVPMTGRAEDQRAVKPDPANPRAINGNFERKLGDNGFVLGWYYQRLLTWETDPLAPEGKHFVTFKNDQEGRSAHLLQGFPIDGRLVAEIKVSAKVKHSNVFNPPRSNSVPSLAVTFYDKNRKDLGIFWLGPFRGDSAWKSESKTFRVPVNAREGILRIGLYGATGQLSFDDVKITPRPR